MNCPRCDTPIDEHEASRCLNAWVAEDVMGEPRPDYVHGSFHLESKPSELGAWYCLCEYDQGDTCKWHPENFSGYIPAAWEVVEKLRQEFYVDIGVDVHGVQVQLNKYDGEWGVEVESIRADTFQLAVCKAALKAVYEREDHGRNHLS